MNIAWYMFKRHKPLRMLFFLECGLWMHPIGTSASGDAGEAFAGLVWEQREGYRIAELPVPGTGKTGLTLLAPEQTDIGFRTQLSLKRATENQNLLTGVGLAAGDYDGDGRCELYFCNIEGANALYRNFGGMEVRGGHEPSQSRLRTAELPRSSIC